MAASVSWHGPMLPSAWLRNSKDLLAGGRIEGEQKQDLIRGWLQATSAC
jgi:hypothetical protein